jgi:hypothetical protein
MGGAVPLGIGAKLARPDRPLNPGVTAKVGALGVPYAIMDNMVTAFDIGIEEGLPTPPF